MYVTFLDQGLHFHPDLASTLEDLSVDTLFALIGQELRNLHSSCYTYRYDRVFDYKVECEWRHN